MPIPRSTDQPRILLLVDKPNWAFDFIAKSIVKRLSDRYNFSIRYVRDKPDLGAEPFDLLYVFFWGEIYHQQFSIDPQRIIKEVASHRWEERLSTSQFVEQYLSDCRYITTPSKRLYSMLRPLRPNVYHCPNGVEHDLFRLQRRRSGPLRIGWVGNPRDPCKGLQDILVPACSGRFRFSYANGTWSQRQLVKFYNSIDVLAIASSAEGQPLPLMEAMTCGCFPVATDVGIVPELINSGFNGLVVERSPEAFREAFSWCEDNLARIRRVGAYNAALCTAARSWDKLICNFAHLFDIVMGVESDDQSRVDHQSGEFAGAIRNSSQSSYQWNFSKKDMRSSVNYEDIDENAYESMLESYEMTLRAILPTSRECQILIIESDCRYLTYYLRENGYLYIRTINYPTNLRRIVKEYQAVDQPIISDTEVDNFLTENPNTFDVIILSGEDKRLSFDDQHQITSAVFSALKPKGRVIWQLPNNSKVFGVDSTDSNCLAHSSLSNLLELLSQVGFIDPNVYKPKRYDAQRRTKLLDRILSLALKQPEGRLETKLQSVVVWAEKSSR